MELSKPSCHDTTFQSRTLFSQCVGRNIHQNGSVLWLRRRNRRRTFFKHRRLGLDYEWVHLSPYRMQLPRRERNTIGDLAYFPIDYVSVKAVTRVYRRGERMPKKAWSALPSACVDFQSEQAVMSRTDPLGFQQEVSRFVLT
ncbi:uncharacterized protein LOC128878192 [Hylaeus volcanicus]|uniref:uncharacterized protein LOC128878192 n=1 Tax=Hylaeus volcanicus TaxID=313075 RepID=UPI0023B82DF4|nr:uncharacterized protein LOC128878192 [Hylaeus volcanicus]